jgi:hypothetical protein
MLNIPKPEKILNEPGVGALVGEGIAAMRVEAAGDAKKIKLLKVMGAAGNDPLLAIHPEIQFRLTRTLFAHAEIDGRPAISRTLDKIFHFVECAPNRLP